MSLRLRQWNDRWWRELLLLLLRSGQLTLSILLVHLIPKTCGGRSVWEGQLRLEALVLIILSRILTCSVVITCALVAAALLHKRLEFLYNLWIKYWNALRTTAIYSLWNEGLKLLLRLLIIVQATRPRLVRKQQIQKEFLVYAEMRVDLAVAASSILWQKDETLVNGVPPILNGVIVWTMIFLTFILQFAWIDFVIQWMILLFFPAMAGTTPIFILATIGIRSDEVVDLPVLTKFLLIGEYLRFPAKVLPVMSIDTPFFIVVVAPRTPHRLEVKHIEIWILGLNLVQEVDCDFVFGMGEGTHLSVFTVLHIMWVGLAELALVLFRMVKFFNSVMGLQTRFASTIDTHIVILTVRDFWAHFWSIGAKSPSSILFEIMVKEASLWVVWLHIACSLHQGLARFCLERLQIKKKQNVAILLWRPVGMRWVERQTFFAHGHRWLRRAVVLLRMEHFSRILKTWIGELILPIILISGHSAIVLAALSTMCPMIASSLISPISTCLVAELLLVVTSALLIIWLTMLIGSTSAIMRWSIRVLVEEIVLLDLTILVPLIMILAHGVLIARAASCTIKCLAAVVLHILLGHWIIWLLTWCTLIMLFLIIVHFKLKIEIQL